MLILSSDLFRDLLSGLFPSDFPIKILYAFLFYLCATHPIHLIFLDLTVLIILGEEYNLQTLSLYKFLYPPEPIPRYIQIFSSAVSYHILSAPVFHGQYSTDYN
jgi:hypothetical protein